MHCEKLEAKIDTLLDDRLPLAEDSEVAAHLADCPTCSEKVAIYEAMLRGTNALPMPELRNDFAATVISSLAYERRESSTLSFKTWKIAISAVAVAASLLIMTMWWADNSSQEGTPNEEGPAVAVGSDEEPMDAFYADFPTSIPHERVQALAATTGRGIATWPMSLRPVEFAFDVFKRSRTEASEAPSKIDNGTGWLVSAKVSMTC